MLQHRGVYVRSLHVTEMGTLNLDPSITQPRCLNDLMSDVLAFAITICPDDQKSRILGLALEVLGNRLLILLQVSEKRWRLEHQFLTS